MPYHRYMNKNKTITFYSFVLPLLLIGLAVIVGVAGYSMKSNPSGVLGKKIELSDAGSERGKGKGDEKMNEGAALNSSGKSKAENYRKSLESVTLSLDESSDDSEHIKDPKVAGELKETSTELSSNTEDTVEAIEDVESRPRWQTLLFGSDYKNLGQLRSQIAHNENSIRKLTKNLSSLSDPAASDLVQTQIDELTTQQESIKSLIQENESQFSLLGWLFKFFNKYPTGSGDGTNESTETTNTNNEGL